MGFADCCWHRIVGHWLAWPKKGLLQGASPRPQIPGAVVGRLVFDYLLSDGSLISSFYFDDFLYSTDCWLVKVRAKVNGDCRLLNLR